MTDFENILKDLGFDIKDFPKIMNYIKNYQLAIDDEMRHVYNPVSNISTYDKGYMQDLLPLNLLILSKIKNLDKVHFIPKPVDYYGDKIISIETRAYKFSMTHFDLMDFQHINGGVMNPRALMEEIGNERFREIISEDINEKIEQGHDVVIYQLVSRFAMISESTMAPQITCYSRMNYIENKSITINDL